MSEPDISRDIPSGGITIFPEDSWVEVRYPLTGEQGHGDRAAWPWLPGWVVSRCGTDEWGDLCPDPRTGNGARGRDGVPGVLPGFLQLAHLGRGPGVMSSSRSGPDRDSERQEPSADHREPRAYVTVISVPNFGDGGVQRLYTPMKDPGPEPEADLGDAGIEAG